MMSALRSQGAISLAWSGRAEAGKTTLAKVLLGIVKDYNGEVIHHTSFPRWFFRILFQPESCADDPVDSWKSL